MKQIFLLMLALVLAAVMAPATAGDIMLIEAAQTTAAVPHEKPPIKYPAGTRANRLEAWVTVAYTVEADGTTSDIEVIDESIDRIFGDAAEETVSTWTYDPATMNGEPVASRTSARLIYAIRGQRDAVSNSLSRRFKGISRELADGDLDSARKGIEKLDDMHHRSLADVVYMEFMRAEYYERVGDESTAREHLERALVAADIAVAEGTYQHLLRSAIRLDAKAGLVADALAHYDDLVESAGQLEADDPAALLAQQLRGAIDGPDPIILDAELEPCVYCEVGTPYAWSHKLARNRFSFSDLADPLAIAEVWCGVHKASFAAEADLAYNVQAGDEECSLRVRGEQPTTFRFVELPPAATLSSASSAVGQ